jgi:CheY-like chemotaxis protein
LQLITISVADTGIGIPAERLAQVFERYTQADDSTTRQYGGTGLGLAICKRLVELMGGEIGAESEAGKGSTFWVRLPLEVAEEALTPPAGAMNRAPTESGSVGARFIAPAGSEVGRVLVVDDDPVGRRIAANLVERLGYEVDAVTDGQAAIDAVVRHAYALVLMDCQMPGVDGFTATAEIRQREAALGEGARRVPIVALSASSLDSDRARGLAAGLDEYLTKPLDGERLAALLERWAPCGMTVPSPPILDPAGLLGSTATLSPQHREIVELFLEEMPHRLAALSAAATRGDRSQVARLAHTLAGSSSSLGAARLAHACARLEALAQAEDQPTEVLAGSLETVRQELRQLQATLDGITAG